MLKPRKNAVKGGCAVKRLDDLPSPYLSGFFDLRSCRSLEISASRGCSRRCSYCAFNESPLRYFSFNRIKRELDYVLAHAPRLKKIMLGVADIYENEALARRLLPLFGRVAVKRGIEVSFYANVDSLHKVELLKLSNSPGFRIEIGVQSLNTEVLSLCNRGNSPARIMNNIALMARHAPRARKVLGLIRGLPGDTPGRYLTTLEWALSTGMDFSVNQLRLVHGTGFQEYFNKPGFSVGSEYPYFVLSTPGISASAMSLLRNITDAAVFLSRTVFPCPSARRRFEKLACEMSGTEKLPRVRMAMSFFKQDGDGALAGGLRDFHKVMKEWRARSLDSEADFWKGKRLPAGALCDALESVSRAAKAGLRPVLTVLLAAATTF